MSWGGNEPETVRHNRLNYLEKLGLDWELAIGADQVHGDQIFRAERHHGGAGFLEARGRIPATDGLITQEPGIILTTLHADCAPIFYADSARRAIGVAHAGWRGIYAGLPGKMLQEIERQFGSTGREIRISVGPMIGADHYEVTPELAGQFEARFGPEVVMKRAGGLHLDLFATLVVNLLEAGLDADRIPARPPCTYENPDYASYRRDGPPARSMIAWLTISS
jgi:hypothetical protein